MFGAAYDEERYLDGGCGQDSSMGLRIDPDWTVIRQCALEKDLELFDAGDETQVGEKGITLRYESWLVRWIILLT